VDYARDVPDKLQQLVTNKASIVTPGVAKEVNYALEVKKTVYELVRSKLKTSKQEASVRLQRTSRSALQNS
jgi:hypothetical protein